MSSLHPRMAKPHQSCNKYRCYYWRQLRVNPPEKYITASRKVEP